MTTFTPNPITNAVLNERFTMELTASGGSTDGYTFDYYVGIPAYDFYNSYDRIDSTTYTAVIPDFITEILLSLYWDTNSVSLGWFAKVYYNGTLVQTTNTANIAMTIPDYDPIITYSVKDVNSATLALTGNENKILLGFSIPKVRVTVRNRNQWDMVSIDEYTMSAIDYDDQSVVHDVSQIVSSPSAANETYFEVTLTDPVLMDFSGTFETTRGYTRSYRYAPLSWTGSDYFAPFMISNEFVRDDSNATVVKLNCQPKAYMQSFGVQSNTLTLAIQVKEYGQDDSDYVTKNTYSISTNPSDVQTYAITGTYATTTNYVFRWVLTDKLQSVYGKPRVVHTLYPVYAISDDRMDIFGDLHIHFGDLYVDSLFYKDGDTYHVADSTPMTAYITTTATTIRIAIPVPKSLKRISSVTVTACTGAIISPQVSTSTSGYLNVPSATSAGSHQTDWLNASDVTVSATITHDHLIKVTLVGTSAFYNATNNRPLVYVPAFDGLTLTFGGS